MSLFNEFVSHFDMQKNDVFVWKLKNLHVIMNSATDSVDDIVHVSIQT